MRRLLALFALTVLVFIPSYAFAATLFEGPLVSCAGPFCQLCDLMKTLNNVIKFAVSFSVIVATLMFAYAGVLYFTASAKQDNIKKAHGIFTKVFMGLVLILIAWLVVDTVMKTFLSGNFGPWNDIQCGKWPDSIVLEANGLGVENPNDSAFMDTPQQPFNGPGGQCVAQSQQLAQSYKPTAGQHQCDPSAFIQTRDELAPTIAKIKADASMMAAIQQCSQKYGVPQWEIAALIAQESGGNRKSEGPDAPTLGLMQLGVKDARNSCGAPCAGMTDQQIRDNLLAQNGVSQQQSDMFSICIGAKRIRALHDRFPEDPRKAIAGYNTTGGLQPSNICVGKLVLECPIMSADAAASCERRGLTLNWSGNRKGNCWTSCEVTCARLDNFETVRQIWGG